MRICQKCGAKCEDHVMFCHECGSPLGQNNGTMGGMESPYDNMQNNYGGQPNGNMGYGGNMYQSITPRSIPVAVILSIITCGIYGIYWMIKMNDEINQLAGEPQATSGGMVFLLSLITCNIYGLYWMYKMGERCDRIKGVYGNSGALYLIISCLGLQIVGYCLMQDTINHAV